ncbi:E3 ubiquitin-protein ligase RHA2A-like [Bidens hawaiensis]|uniref:E3 ubiquitin-protein ligase RHA2A-like n=1 Tax=Bidens hawaiensis TaxID=980011 RepID=UPI00404B18FD
MGLQNQLTDISSDSIPLFFLTSIITFISYIQSLLLNLVGYQYYYPDDVDDTIGSGLAGIIMLADQLNLNRVFSYKYNSNNNNNNNNNNNTRLLLSDSTGTMMNTDCVVCLNVFADGDHVRKLSCRHVFHKECLDGWLDQMNFRCPLCRSPVVCDERVRSTRRRVAGDVMGWFSVR